MNVEVQIDQLRIRAQNIATKAKGLSTPGDMAAAQRNLELVYDLRSAALAKIAAHAPAALGGQEPQAVANFFLDFDKTLAYLAIDFPQPLAPLIRTTNLLERFHKEMRRKQRDIGMFQSEQGCDVLWYLVSMRETAKQRAAVQT